MIKPTVSRSIWFWPVATERGLQPYAAIVTYVYDDNMVNLAVFNTDGALFPAIAVAIVQDGSPYVAGDLPYAEWPPAIVAGEPYQKGQAAKAEALEATLLSAAEDAAKDDDRHIQAHKEAEARLVEPAAVTENDPSVPAQSPLADPALPAAGNSTL